MKPTKEKEISKQTINRSISIDKKVIPPNILARKCSVIYQPLEYHREYHCDNSPMKLFPEWNDKEAEQFNLDFEKRTTETEPSTKFEDPEMSKINLPYSIQSEAYFNVKWLRPEVYIKENLLDKEITKRHTGVNNIKFREQIKEVYESNVGGPQSKAKRSTKRKTTRKKFSSSDISLNESHIGEEIIDYNQHNINKLIPKEFIELLSKPAEIKVASVTEIEETDEEYEKRISMILAEENKKKSKTQFVNNNQHNNQIGSSTSNYNINHNGNNPNDDKKIKHQNFNNSNKIQGQINEHELIKQKIIYKRFNFHDINMEDKYPDYCKWVGSIFQIINDRKIVDANTSENIYQKIYPQKEGIPVYNPHGRYWIKLNYMGKPRKVEIDDLMPCTKYDEFLLPKSEMINELWPALITKALIKLYSHKFSGASEEIGDSSIFYSLTGYVGEKISFTNPLFIKEEAITNMLNNIIKDENYKNHQPILLAYAKIVHDKNTYKDSESKHKIIEKKMSSRALKRPGLPDSDSLNSLNEAKNIFRTPKRFSTTIHSNLIYDMLPGGKSFSKTEMNLYQNMLYDFISQSYTKNKNNQNPTKDTNFGSVETNVKQNERVGEKIYGNFLYSVLEIFDNNNFNMKRLKPLDFTDLREKIRDYLKAPLKQLSLDDKKIYIQKLKELKAKQKEEKIKRIEELKQEGKKIRLIKIKNSTDKNLEHLFVPYTNQEIEMTKKCLLNNWDFPPPSYLDKVFSNKIESQNEQRVNSQAVSEPLSKEKPSQIPNISTNQIQINSNNISKEISLENNISKDSPGKVSKKSWAYDNYLALINNNLQKYEASKEPLTREEGTWIYLNDFYSLFNHFMILYNPKHFRSYISYDSNWYNYENDIYEHNPEYTVFRLIPANNDIQNRENLSRICFNNRRNSERSCIVFNFHANSDSRGDLKDSNFYLLFEIYDKQKNLVEPNLKITNLHMTMQYDAIKFDQEYFIHLKGGVYPMGFYLSMMSDHMIENMSYATYLKSYCDYSCNTFKISHKSLEKDKTSLLMRLKIKNNNIDTKLFFKLNSKNYSDNYLLKFFDLYLSHSQNISKNKIYFVDTCELPASPDSYYIILTATPPYNILENNFEFEVLSSNPNIYIEHIERIEILEIGDLYIPNKHGIIFKELIFGIDKTYATFSINITQIQRNQIATSMDTSESNSFVPSDRRISLKTNEIEVDKLQKTKYVVEIYDSRNNSLIFKSDFYNSILIPNVVLNYDSPFLSNLNISGLNDNKKTAKDNQKEINYGKPFLLICYFHESEFPNCLNITKTNDLCWSFRTFGSDTLAFVKDTTKEDSERAMKESWEQKEPGRAEKAKRSRIRFLIQQKIENNLPVTEEEENFIREDKEKRLKTEITVINSNNANQKEENKNNRATNPADRKKRNSIVNLTSTGNKSQTTPTKGVIASTNIPTEISEHNKDAMNLAGKKSDINLNKPVFVAEKHIAAYIKNFLNYSSEKRTKILDSNLKEEEKMVHDDEKKLQEKKEKVISRDEKFNLLKNKETEAMMNKLSMLNDTMKAFYDINMQHKIDQQETKNLFKLKDDSKKYISKKDAEKKLMEIIQNKENDLNVCIQTFKEIAASSYKSDLLENVHDLISKKKEEFIKFELKKNEKNLKELKAIAQKYIDDMNENKWKLSNEITIKLYELSK